VLGSYAIAGAMSKIFVERVTETIHTMGDHANPFLPVVLCFLKRIALLYRSLVLFEVSMEASEGYPSSVTYIGEGESIAYIMHLLTQKPAAALSRRLPLWRLRKRLRDALHAQHIVIVEGNRLLQWCIPQAGYETVPWIRQIVDLHDASYQNRRPKIEATFGRLVRKNSFAYTTTQDQRRGTYFYNHVYLPYITSRYLDKTHPRAISEMHSAMKHGFLLEVYDHDRLIAGAICRKQKHKVTAVAFGVARPHDELLRKGALTSVYYFLFKWAESNGMKQVDLLRSRANLEDGVFEHKRRWGARPMLDGWPHTFIRIFPVPRGGMPLLLRQQLILHDGKWMPINAIYPG
jgi:hypothetical protein